MENNLGEDFMKTQIMVYMAVWNAVCNNAVSYKIMRGRDFLICQAEFVVACYKPIADGVDTIFLTRLMLRRFQAVVLQRLNIFVLKFILPPRHSRYFSRWYSDKPGWERMKIGQALSGSNMSVILSHAFLHSRWSFPRRFAVFGWWHEIFLFCRKILHPSFFVAFMLV